MTLGRIAGFIVSTLAVLPAWAGLNWEQTAVTINAEPRQQKVEAVYKFANNGQTAVTISDIKTSCGCTTTQLAKRLYAPGETGSIRATMTLDEYGGTRTKKIYVLTDDAQNPSYTLEISGVKPEYLKFPERHLHWTTRTEAETKVLAFSTGTERPVHIARVECDNPAAFDVKLQRDQDGRAYRLQVTPKSTEKEVYGMIDLHTDLPPELGTSVFRIAARVLEPFPAPAGAAAQIPAVPIAGPQPAVPAPAKP